MQSGNTGDGRTIVREGSESVVHEQIKLPRPDEVRFVRVV